MIVSCKGDVAIHGSKNCVHAEYCLICCNLLKEQFSEEELAQAIVLAKIFNQREREKDEESND